MERGLACTVHSRLGSVTATEWSCLFPDLPDSAEMVAFVQRSGMDGFSFYSLTVRKQDRLLLYVPLFTTTYHLAQLLEGWTRPIAEAAARWVPFLLSPRVLGIGFVEGEWGQIGSDPEASLSELEAAWDVALEGLERLAQTQRADLIAFANFTTQSGRLVPMQKLQRFMSIASRPYGQLPIAYPTLEAYLASLSKNTRKDLRRKMHRAEGITVQRTRSPAPWLDQIYQWYLQTTAHAEIVFGVHPRAYFAQVCDAVPHAEYVFYFVQGTLAAFNLVIARPDILVDKYFGMDEMLGRQHGLYFISWLENIRYCVARQIPLYHAGQGAEATKHRLKARLLPSCIVFRHRNAILHQLLKYCMAPLVCHPQVDMAPAQLGTAWQPSPQAPTRTLGGFRSHARRPLGAS